MSVSLFFATPSFAQLSRSAGGNVTIEGCKLEQGPYSLNYENKICFMGVRDCKDSAGRDYFNKDIRARGPEGDRIIEAYTECVFENIPDNGLAGVDITDGSYTPYYSIDRVRDVEFRRTTAQENHLLGRFEKQCNARLGVLLRSPHNRLQYYTCLKQNHAFDNLVGNERRSRLATTIKRCIQNHDAIPGPNGHRYVALDYDRGVIECNSQEGAFGHIKCPVNPDDCANNREGEDVELKEVPAWVHGCERAGRTRIAEKNGVMNCEIPVVNCRGGASNVEIKDTIYASCPLGMASTRGGVTARGGLTSYICPRNAHDCVNNQQYEREGKGLHVKYDKYGIEVDVVAPTQSPRGAESVPTGTGTGTGTGRR